MVLLLEILPSHQINNHEEADTLVLLHAIEASSTPLPEDVTHFVTIYSSDTDIFVLLVSFYDKLPPHTYMRTTQDRIIDIRKSVATIGHDKAKALIGLHGFTGCDTTRKFRKKGKLTWWKSFEKAPSRTVDAFCSLGGEKNLDDQFIAELVGFVCNLYCKKYKVADLAEARWHIFRSSTMKIDNLPPTKSAFIQHIKRSNFQCRIWKQAANAIQDIDDPEKHGWRKENECYHAIGFDGEVAPSDIIQLIKCGCKTGCAGFICRCKKNDLCCTDMCECEECENRDDATFSVDGFNEEEDEDDE